MKTIYFFDESDGKNKKLLGGKGAGLCEMVKLGLPIPPGFVITTEVCKKYYQNKMELPNTLLKQIIANIKKIEHATGKKWGSDKNPLLVSVRSGAAISMPGMMDTILNLGLNDKTVEGLAKSSHNKRFALDSYRRFIQLFGKVVFNINDEKFNAVLDKIKKEHKIHNDNELDINALQKIISEFKIIYQNTIKMLFPSDPYEQLQLAIKAVFNSWTGKRAIIYRQKNKITEDIADGTAVNIVSMVFGNLDNKSSTGVVFTRNPNTGDKKIFGDYLTNAQGEDIVAGIRTPKHIDQMKNESPKIYKQLIQTCKLLEKHYKEPQDIEFTVEQNKFYLLQTRAAKMNAIAMIKTSVDMVKEKIITKNNSLLRLRIEQLEQLLHRTIDRSATNKIKVAQGIGASPGAASGKIIFDIDEAIKTGEKDIKVILVREETKPEDVPAFFASAGILTSRGGKTSHAAVVARGMGKPCIVGADLMVDYKNRICKCNNMTLHENDIITIDGNEGIVYSGEMPTIEPKITNDFKTILNWGRSIKKLGIRANADNENAAILALSYGAEGIGLCRTERMFNAKDRINLFIKMIMSKTHKERKSILRKLGQLQKNDFMRILKVMNGLPVTIRLLDPPLHEFLPNPNELVNRINKLKNIKHVEEIENAKVMLEAARDLNEVNPMMGHRGVRLGITYPEIYEMQIRAVFEATAKLIKMKINAKPQIMVPQVSDKNELKYIKKIYNDIKSNVESKYKFKLNIKFGTMLEVVRSCLTSTEIASEVEFFSFGTNDLTQAVFSFSREDVESKFLSEYLNKNILTKNPFQSIDENGVGNLIKLVIQNCKKNKQKMEIGICGEHGGDPESIKFFQNAQINYVSASPHRIPIAIISSAQTTIINKTKHTK
ncbi:MAG: pyruvate, phosphate dikinase [Nitrosopumilaceae archaeon]|nr:pyruvate, phosphate dikinase [Nitrosopumilaceae archaeon]